MSDNSSMSVTAGHAVHVSEVESELNKLWLEVAQAGGDNPVLRATTVNLVLLIKDGQTVTELIQQVTEGHPARAIVVEYDGADNTLLAVPTLFHVPSLGAEVRQQVRCEEIVLKVGKGVEDRVATSVESLLIADLPVFVYYEGDISLTDPLLMSFGEIANGLIFDSATFSNAETGLADLAALFSSPHMHANLFDLNWHRLLPWRESLAQVFDQKEVLDMLRAGPEADASGAHPVPFQMVITQQAAHTEALLAAGWLASRLGWDLTPLAHDRWVGHAGERGAVIVALKNLDSNPAGLREVDIQAHQYPFKLERSADNQFIISPHSAAHRLLDRTRGALICALFDLSGQDRIFPDALNAAVLLSHDKQTVTPRASVIVADNAAAQAKLAARYFVVAAREAIAARGVFTVALSGGSTPKALYALLAEAPYKDQIHWSKVHVFWGDERNVPLDDAESNQLMAHTTFLDKLTIPAENIHGPLTDPQNPDTVAEKYAGDIRAFFKIGASELPRFDLVLLGLGDDGHTASLFPHSPGLTADDNLLFIANPVEKLKTTRLSLTAGAINAARSVMFLVSGSGKSDIVFKVFAGPLQPDEYPSQRIQPTEGSLLVLADRDAAAKLQQ